MGLHNVTFLSEETKRALLPFLEGEIVDNSKISVSSTRRMQRSHSRGRTKKWLTH